VLRAHERSRSREQSVLSTQLLLFARYLGAFLARFGKADGDRLLPRFYRFLRRIALATRFDAAFPYFRPPLRLELLLRVPVRRRAAMLTPGRGPSARYSIVPI
jgi:hypothetical protein